METKRYRDWAFLMISIVAVGFALAIEVAAKGVILIKCLYFLAILGVYFTGDNRKVVFVGLLSALALLIGFMGIYTIWGWQQYLNLIITELGVAISVLFVITALHMKAKAEKDNKQVGSMFTHATEGIVLTDKSRKILLVNPCAERMFGYTADELRGKNIELLLPDNLRKKHVEYVEHFHAHPMNRSMGAGRDLYARRKDGSVFPVEISLSHYTSGREAYVIAFVIDITIRKQSEQLLKQKNDELNKASQQVKQMNTELEQKVADRTTMLRETLGQLERSKNELAESLEKEKELGDLKSRFVSTVSHEFRTPLSTILSSTALIGKYTNESDQDKRDKHIKRIKEQVHHMNNMLEDLLILGKLEEGKMQVQHEPFELADFIQDFVAEMQPLVKDGQTIQAETPFQANLETDKRLLKNILINLTSNAIKFSPEHAQIDLVVDRDNDDLLITVSDKGIGISEEDQQHLFERFFRARNAQNIQGTGLGLHIVSKYLELLSGSIRLKSEIGQGTSFTIIIPSAILPS
ncbi:MAG: PAS domain-containing sensor histidine kinase [Chitinophagales bacterium]|nr:PAS domain-containing sensor histidine kinase [Chitinophagales bacterium]